MARLAFVAENLAAFMATTVAPLHFPLVMRRNPVRPKFVLVHGRRGEHGESDLGGRSSPPSSGRTSNSSVSTGSPRVCLTNMTASLA